MKKEKLFINNNKKQYKNNNKQWIKLNNYLMSQEKHFKIQNKQ